MSRNQQKYYITTYPSISWVFTGRVCKVDASTLTKKEFNSVEEASYFLLTTRLGVLESYIVKTSGGRCKGYYPHLTTITQEEYINQVTKSQINPLKRKIHVILKSRPELCI